MALQKLLCGKAHCHDAKSIWPTEDLVLFDESIAENITKCLVDFVLKKFIMDNSFCIKKADEHGLKPRILHLCFFSVSELRNHPRLCHHLQIAFILK
jgi:hypothetical protein